MALKSGVLAITVGAVYGAMTSLINDVSSPYGMIGSRVAGTAWAFVAEVTSRLIGLGWAWAGLAMAAGFLVGVNARGAFAAVLTLLAATTMYYAMDSVLREESFALYWSELQLWWLASVVAGTMLGVVGANIRRPGVIGLLAGLALPVGAIIQTILVQLNETTATPAMKWAWAIVWVAAAVGAGAVLTRFVRSKLRQRDLHTSDNAIDR